MSIWIILNPFEWDSLGPYFLDLSEASQLSASFVSVWYHGSASHPLDLCFDFDSKGCWALFHTQPRGPMAFFSLRWSRKLAPAAGWNWARDRRTVRWLVVRSFFWTFIPCLGWFPMDRIFWRRWLHVPQRKEPYGEANFTQFWPALPQPWVQFWDPWWPLLRLASRGYAGPDPWKAAGHQQKQWPCGILSAQQVHTRGIFAIIVVCVFIHTDWCGFARLLGCPPQKLILCHWCVTCAILAATSTISVPRRQRIASIQSNLGMLWLISGKLPQVSDFGGSKPPNLELLYMWPTENHLHKGPCQSWLVWASLVRMDFLLHFQGGYLKKIWSCYSHDVPIAAAELKIRSVRCTCDLRGKKGTNPVTKIAGSYEGFIPQQWRMPVRISTLYSVRGSVLSLWWDQRNPQLYDFIDISACQLFQVQEFPSRHDFLTPKNQERLKISHTHHVKPQIPESSRQFSVLHRSPTVLESWWKSCRRYHWLQRFSVGGGPIQNIWVWWWWWWWWWWWSWSIQKSDPLRIQRNIPIL